MPHVLDRPKGRVAAGAVGSVLLLAAVLTPLAIARTGPTHGTGATWDSNVAAGSIASTVYVAAIDCSAVPAGTYAGQASGIELVGRYAVAGRTVHPGDFAGVYAYCSGHTAHYSAQFVVLDTTTGEIDFRRAGVAVAPGDPLSLAIRTEGAHEVLTLEDMNTKRSAHISGPLLDHGFGWRAGAMPIDADAAGAPATHGSQRLGDEYAVNLTPATIRGPVPTAPAVFDGTTVDGRPISSSTTGIYASSWKNAAGKALESVTRAVGGDFDAALLTVTKPRLGHTAALTRVGGDITIELPGTHRFIHVGSLADIPDGTVINADHGSVQITVALPDGKSQTGVFYDGEFRLSQRDDGRTTATLAGGTYAGCPSDGARTAPGRQPRAQIARTRKGDATKGHGKKLRLRTKDTKIRSLWSNAHGSFVTKGSYGAAAVLGTRWYTEDRCDGTYFYVARDKIEVTAYYPRPHRVLVLTGHHYLAQAISPSPRGAITHDRVGAILLAQPRAKALADYPFGTPRGFTYKYYFKLSSGGIRIGFASPKLMRVLPQSVRRQVAGRVVWASTWSSHYLIDGIREHDSLTTLQRKLPGGQLITVGINDWYLVRYGHNTAVFKIDDERVSELGIALGSVTATRGEDQTLMSSFDT